MFATKTIYANTEWPVVKDIIASVFSGFALSFAFVAYYVRYIYRQSLLPYPSTNTLSDDTTTSESEEEQQEDESKQAAIFAFQNSFYDELEALAELDISAERRKELSKFKYQEVTPDGEIVLYYDDRAEAFCYYCDNYLKVSYKTLDAMARQFAVLYNCKTLCVNARQELILAKEKVEKDSQHKINTAAQTQPRSVFAKFKKYDKVYDYNAANLIPVPERGNRFIYRGNLLVEKNNAKSDVTTACATAACATAAVVATDIIDHSSNTVEQEQSNTMDYVTFKRLILTRAQ